MSLTIVYAMEFSANTTEVTQFNPILGHGDVAKVSHYVRAI